MLETSDLFLGKVKYETVFFFYFTVADVSKKFPCEHLHDSFVTQLYHLGVNVLYFLNHAEEHKIQFSVTKKSIHQETSCQISI